MRELGVSIADLKKLQSNELSLTEEMEHQIQALTAQQAKLQKEQQICIAIQQEHVSYEQLDADKYLYHSIAPDTACEIDPAKDSSYQAQDRLPQISPVRRYLARMFDMILFTDIAVSIISLFHINFNDIWSLPCTNIVIQLIWLFIEPLCIHFIGTTAGKWIFGLYLTDLDGRLPSYYDAYWQLPLFLILQSLMDALYMLRCQFTAVQSRWKNFQKTITRLPAIRAIQNITTR